MKSAIERRMEIANLVGVRGKVSVGDLAEYFGVSGATIRTDLRFLESMGHIVRSNGYVILNKGVIANFSAEPRSRKETVVVGH
ncbi:DeoR family transcriptional regulator [Escherichia coli]|nr:DeoR family transcriptional regulator [Escherichia coli]WJL42657.1 DeoR family transcriptional regulator [Escherichia coli O78:H4]